MRVVIDDTKKRGIIDLYLNGLSVKEIARLYKHNRKTVSSILRQNGVVVLKLGEAPYIPTPKEIQSRAAGVRKDWSRETEEKRRVSTWQQEGV